MPKQLFKKTIENAELIDLVQFTQNSETLISMPNEPIKLSKWPHPIMDSLVIYATRQTYPQKII
jgi:hypothetical protein